MDIPPPPLWQLLLFEQPWPLVIVLLVSAVLLRHAARQRNQPRMGHVGFGLAVAAGAVFALAWLVTTDREMLERQTREVVAATESPTDLATLDRLLSPDAVLTGPGNEIWMEMSAIRRQLEQLGERFPIEQQVIRDIGAQVIDARRGRSAFDLRTYSPHQPGVPYRSVWTLHWHRQDNGDWQIVQVQWEQFMNRPPGHGHWLPR